MPLYKVSYQPATLLTAVAQRLEVDLGYLASNNRNKN